MNKRILIPIIAVLFILVLITCKKESETPGLTDFNELERHRIYVESLDLITRQNWAWDDVCRHLNLTSSELRDIWELEEIPTVDEEEEEEKSNDEDAEERAKLSAKRETSQKRDKEREESAKAQREKSRKKEAAKAQAQVWGLTVACDTEIGEVAFRYPSFFSG